MFVVVRRLVCLVVGLFVFFWQLYSAGAFKLVLPFTLLYSRRKPGEANLQASGAYEHPGSRGLSSSPARLACRLILVCGPDA